MAAAPTQTVRLTVSDGVSVTAKVDAPGRLLRSEAAPPGHDRRRQEEDAGTANSSAIGATGDALSHRTACSGGRGFTAQQPPQRMAPGTPGLVLAHGANNDLDHPLLAVVAERVAAEGAALVLRFNFPYAERGGTSPDSRAVLETAYRRAYELLVNELLAPGAPVFLGGKSLGGRFGAELASGVAESGTLPATGLVVLGYPAHAPGRQDRMNFRPLEGLAVPSLIFVGTRDPFCAPEEIEPVLAGLPVPGRLVVVEGGDHSFHLPKSAGRTTDSVYEAIAAATATFIREVAGAAGATGPGGAPGAAG